MRSQIAGDMIDEAQESAIPTPFELTAVRGRYEPCPPRGSTGKSLSVAADGFNLREDLDMWIEDVVDFALACGVVSRIVREIKARSAMQGK